MHYHTTYQGNQCGEQRINVLVPKYLHRFHKPKRKEGANQYIHATGAKTSKFFWEILIHKKQQLIFVEYFKYMTNISSINKPTSNSTYHLDGMSQLNFQSPMIRKNKE